MIDQRSNKTTIVVVSLITILIAGLLIVSVGSIQKWLYNVSIFWGIVISMATFLVTAIWAWFRHKKYIFVGAVDERLWRDLRIWATILMIVMIVVYLGSGIK